MSNVQVRNIPDELHEQLRERAAAQGDTISDYVLGLIRSDLRLPSRRQWINGVLELPKLDLGHDEILAALDEGRRERDERIGR